MHKIQVFTMLLLIILSVFEPLQGSSLEPQVVINEILYDPEGSDLGFEWIEFYNPTSSSIDLSNWTIEAGGAAFERVVSIPDNSPTILHPGEFYVIGEKNVQGVHLFVEKLAFQNGGNETDGVRIRDSSGNIVDTLLYDEPNTNQLPDDSGNIGISLAPDTVSGSSLGRDGKGTDTDESGKDFKEYSTPTPGKTNETVKDKPPQEEREDEDIEYSRDIVLNEILPDPKGIDSEGEFIELKNLGSQDVDLTRWMIEDASGTPYVIDREGFESTTVPPGGLFVVSRSLSGIALNNTGAETVRLLHPNETLLHEVLYSGSKEEESFARNPQGEFSWTTTPTPEGENIFTQANKTPVADAGSDLDVKIDEDVRFDATDSSDPDGDALTYRWDFGDRSLGEGVSPTHRYAKEGSYTVVLKVSDGKAESTDSLTVIVQEEKSLGAKPIPSLKITEVFPNPKGSDIDGEFIEIQNIGQETVNLEGLILGDSSSTRRKVSKEDTSSLIISPDHYVAIFRKTSKIALNNDGDRVVLLDSNGAVIEEVEYREDGGEGNSFIRLSGGIWAWTTKPTPGEENVFISSNHPPLARIDAQGETKIGKSVLFDASGSSDPDEDHLSLTWDFGDGTKGRGQEVHHAFSREGSYIVRLIIEDDRGAKTEVSHQIEVTPYDLAKRVILNELLPNPKGPDYEEEWIEVTNLEDRPIDLEGWQITDTDEFYTFPPKTIMGSKRYLVVARKDSKISLKNTRDAVYLMNPKGEIVNGVSYRDAKEGGVFARKEFSQEWVWGEVSTPGRKNEIEDTERDGEDQEEDVRLEEEEKPLKDGENKKRKRVQKKEKEEIVDISLKEVRGLNKGTRIEIEGVVVAEPGVFGESRFYVADGEAGIQVFSLKGNFLSLKRGDHIRIKGSLSRAQGESRVNVASEEDIVVLGKTSSLEPLVFHGGSFDASHEGTLIVVQGVIEERKGRRFLVVLNSGDEIGISIVEKVDARLKDLEEGKSVKVTGIVRKGSRGYELYPRDREDLIFPQVLGIKEEQLQTQETLFSQPKHSSFLQYLTGGILGISILVAWVWKKHRFLTTKLRKKQENPDF